MIKKKFFVFMLSVLLVTTLVLAEQQTLGSFKQNQKINLVQTCDNSTYANITRVVYPNNTLIINSNNFMTKNGDNYNFTYSQSQPIGRYLVYGNCDLNGVNSNWAYDFYVESSNVLGLNLNSTIGIIMICLLYSLSIVLFFTKSYLWSGVIMMLSSLILIFSAISVIVPLITLCLSIVIMFIKGDDD